MTELARINLHLPDEVLTINVHYLANLSWEETGIEKLSRLQLIFKPELWQGRSAFPDSGFLLEKAVLGRMIEAFSFVYQDGRLTYFAVPFSKIEDGSNANQRSGLLEDGSLVIEIR